METLYKDNKFELNIDVEDVPGVEFKINNTQYIISSHYYEPCAYIDALDGSTHIVLHNSFDMSYIVSDFKNGKLTNIYIEGCQCKNLTPLRFCELMEHMILKEKAQKKQQIVKETGRKTVIKK